MSTTILRDCSKNIPHFVADSSTATGLKWAAASGGGKVLQVVSGTYSTATTIASTSYTDTGLSLAITPTLATSKVLVLINQKTYVSRDINPSPSVSLQLLRGATVISDTGIITYGFFTTGSGGANLASVAGVNYLDSPNTTSSITYKTQAKNELTANNAQSIFQVNSSVSNITLLEIGA